MKALLVAALATLVSGSSVIAQTSSRPTYTLRGKVVGPPSALQGAIAELVLAGGPAAEAAAVGDDGVFEIVSMVPPDGGIVRVSGPAAATARFDAPTGYPAAAIDLGERPLFSSERLRNGRAPPEPRAWTAGTVVDVYDAGTGAILDERLRLTTLIPDEKGRLRWRTLADDLVVAVTRRADAPGRVLDAKFFAGDDRGAFAAAVPPAEPVAIRLGPEAAGIEFAGTLTLPLYGPGSASAYRLVVRGRFDDVASGKEHRGGFALPEGAVFEGRGFAVLNGAPTVYRYRLVSGDPHGSAIGEAPSSLRFDAKDDADDRVLDVRPSLPDGALHDVYDGLIDVVVAAEPDYEPARLRTGPTRDGSARAVRLFARPRLLGGVSGLSDPASCSVYWRRDAASPPAKLATVRADGGFGPLPIPAGPGEIYVRGKAAAARPEPLPASVPKEAVFVQTTTAPPAELRGRILAEGKPLAGVLVRLLPFPEDAATTKEWSLPPGWRSPASKRRLDDPRARLAFTGKDGAFRFSELDPGSRLLIAEAAERAPFLSPRIELHGALAADYSLDSVGATPPFAPSADLITMVRTPFGPERTLFGTEPVDAATGFFLARVPSASIATPGRVRGVWIAARKPGAEKDGTGVLLHALPETMSGATTPRTAVVRLGGEPVFLPCAGEGRVVVRATSSAFPWTTFGPFSAVDAEKPGDPVFIEPGPPPALVARCWTPEGIPARDFDVRIEPEADRVLLGASPPPIFGRTDENGVVRAPERPAGRAWLVVEGPNARLSRLLDGAPDDVLADITLEPAVLPPRPRADAEYRDADGRRIVPEEVARRQRDRRWSSAAFAVDGSRPDGPVGAARPFLADPRPADSGRPLVLALSGYRGRTAVRLVATVEGEADPREDRLASFADAEGEAYFPAVPAGDYLAMFAGLDGERVVPFHRAEGDPLRVVLPPRETSRAAVAVFDGAGQRRLPGAVARIRPLAVFGSGLGEFSAPESATAARDGRAEFILEAGVRYVLDVVCDEPPVAARVLFGPFAAGVPAADLELRMPLSARVRVLVRGKEPPTTPIPGTAVALFVAGLPYAMSRTNTDGEAFFRDVPSGEPVVFAVGADGYAPGLKTQRLFGGGGVNTVDLDLEFSRTAVVEAAPGVPMPIRLEPESADDFLDPRGFSATFATPPARLRPDRNGRFAIPLGSAPQTLKVNASSEASADQRVFPLRPGEVKTLGPP